MSGSVVSLYGHVRSANPINAAPSPIEHPAGPAIPHRILGLLTGEEWNRFELIHLAHNLSFAVPVPKSP
jgi:hypothetical protein